MPDSASPTQRFAAVSKDLVAALRDGVVFVLFLLLLAMPDTIRGRLVSAGFTKGSIAGFEWEASLERTKETAQSVSQAKRENAALLAQIGEVNERVDDPSLRELATQVAATGDRLKRAELEVKRSLSVQQALVKEIAPQQIASSGWIYLGIVTNEKDAWKPGSPTTVRPVGVELAPGTRLTVKDDVYLRADATSDARGTAPVEGVVRVGEQVDVLAKDYSRASKGGWFVWVNVRLVD